MDLKINRWRGPVIAKAGVLSLVGLYLNTEINPITVILRVH